MIAFYVQGGGLGHLTRIHKLIQYLKIDAKEVLIITPSKFLELFTSYFFVRISWNGSSEDWSKKITEQLLLHNIKQCYVDAFPLGIKGELIPVYRALPSISYIYICRILQWKKYVSIIPKDLIPNFTKTLVLEKIYEEHLNWAHEVSKHVQVVQLPLVLPKENVKLSNTPYALVIHSGNQKDVIELCKKAKTAIANDILSIYVFTQVHIAFDDKRFHIRVQKYPVDQYFKYANKIITAAGFNLIHELEPYHKKHIVIPIDRLYDDQFFRAQNCAALSLK